MQQPETPKVNSTINVTPLVDVVLVLLIIFMVVAPQLQAGPALQLPTTDRPPDKPDDGKQILVALEHDGTIWVEDGPIRPEEFPERIAALAERYPSRQVVIKGDARLSYGDVKRAMLAVEAHGFKDVGLIAERRESGEN